jgi:WS/DGAT/MGAT family acyltransferase
VTDVVPDVVRNGMPSALSSPAPRTSFNEAIGDRRTIAYTSLPLADVKAVRRALGVTVNDVIVAVCASALERFLERVGEGVPDRPFIVAVPVSMRAPNDDGELTNRVAAFPIRVPSHATDAAERLRAISEETERGKQLSAMFAAHRLPSVAEIAPPFVLGALARAFAPLIPRVPVIANTMVSTVRGAPFPLYVAGARIAGMYPTNMLIGNMGLDFTTISSEDRVDIGVTADPDLVPDPWLVAEALPRALEDLVCAAGVDAD